MAGLGMFQHRPLGGLRVQLLENHFDCSKCSFCCMFAPDGVSAGGGEGGGGDVGGPVSPHQRVPEGAADAHTDPGPHPVLQSPTSQPRGLPGNQYSTRTTLLHLSAKAVARLYDDGGGDGTLHSSGVVNVF